MVLLRGVLVLICMLFCGHAMAHGSFEEMTIEGTNEKETESKHYPERDDVGDGFLRESFKTETDLVIEGTQEGETDSSFDDQDVDDEATEDSEDSDF